MSHQKQPFFTDAFYKSPFASIEVLNEIKEKQFDRDFDMYGSGEFLYMAALDCPSAREILSRVISDIDAYLAHYEGQYTDPTPGTIILNGLSDEIIKAYGYSKELMWHEEDNCFYTAEQYNE